MTVLSPRHEENNMSVTTIGIDLAKNVFHIHGVDAEGRTVLRRKTSRAGFERLMAGIPGCRVGMEAGSGSHHWARQLQAYGHEVKLMPPRYVRPYVKTNKHDAADAEACCEAVQRPGMRFVPIKTVEQQAVLMLHKVRDHLVCQRTGTINALRGHMAEFGITAATQRRGLGELIDLVENETDSGLPAGARDALLLLVEQIRAADKQIKDLDRRIMEAAKASEMCQRLVAVPGIGPVIATALAAHLPCPDHFTSGRHFAAWLGLTPRQHSSGGKDKILGISKRGNAYLRRQLVNGARAVVRVAPGREGILWSWTNQLLNRRPFNVVVAAVASKLARIAWSMCAHGTTWGKPEAA
jgi:transposase